MLVRADNPARAARVRQLIEQLDTPGRAGGNMFIVYLKNAEAARVAQTLRALLTGSDARRAPERSSPPRRCRAPLAATTATATGSPASR